MTPIQALPRPLIAGFGFLFLLALLVVGSSVHYLGSLRHELENVVYSQMQRIDRAHQMRTTLRERMIRLERIFLESDPFLQDEQFQEFLLLGNRFITLRSELEPMAEDEVERHALAAFRQETITTSAILERVTAFYQQGDLEAGRLLLLREGVPSQDKVLRASDTVHALYNQRGEAIVAQARRVYDDALRVVSGLGISAILLLLVTAVLVIRRTLQDRRTLLAEIDTRRGAEVELRNLGRNLEAMVTERTARLQQTTDLLKEAQRIGQMGHWEWDIPSGALSWSEETYHLFGLDPERHHPSYETLLESIHPDDRDKVTKAVKTALQEGHYQVSHRTLRPDGTVRQMQEQGRVSYDDNGQPLRMIGTVQDVSEAHHLQQQLWNLAHHDPLTGLPNRSLLMDRLQQALHLAERQGGTLAVALFDLDHFKAANDSLGHAAGDQLLKEVASRLQGAVRQSDTIARYAGDEFVGVFPGMGTPDEARTLLDKVLDGLATPCRLQGTPWQISTSIGVAFYPADGRNAEALLHAADAAMYAAKQAGRNGYQFHAAAPAAGALPP